MEVPLTLASMYKKGRNEKKYNKKINRCSKNWRWWKTGSKKDGLEETCSKVLKEN